MQKLQIRLQSRLIYQSIPDGSDGKRIIIIIIVYKTTVAALPNHFDERIVFPDFTNTQPPTNINISFTTKIMTKGINSGWRIQSAIPTDACVNLSANGSRILHLRNHIAFAGNDVVDNIGRDTISVK